MGFPHVFVVVCRKPGFVEEGKGGVGVRAFGLARRGGWSGCGVHPGSSLVTILSGQGHGNKSASTNRYVSTRSSESV